MLIAPLVLVIIVCSGWAQGTGVNSAGGAQTSQGAGQVETQGTQQKPLASGVLDEESIRLDDGVASVRQQGVQAPEGIGFWEYFRMILVLALVVGVLLGVYFLVRRGNKARPQETSVIRVLSTQALSPSKALHVVSLGQHIYLIGSTDQSLNLLGTVDDKESRDEILLEAGREAEEGKKSFADLISAFVPHQGRSGRGGTP